LIEAKKQPASTLITWKVAAEENVSSYELEKSVDGSNFNKIGAIVANQSSAYSLIDNSPSSIAYYRVKNIDRDGKFKYSSILKVSNGASTFIKKVYPVPAINEVYLQQEPVTYGATISLLATDGRWIKTIIPQANSMQTKIELAGLAKGLYLLKYSDGKGSEEVLKLVKE